MERVQNTILLHGVAYVQRLIALDTKKTCIKRAVKNTLYRKKIST